MELKIDEKGRTKKNELVFT